RRPSREPFIRSALYIDPRDREAESKSRRTETASTKVRLWDGIVGGGPVRQPSPRSPPQIASLLDVKWKSRARIAGTIIDANSLPPARTATLVASRFFSKLTGLSLNRKLFTGWTIFPFSTSQTPSRVRPVTVAFRGFTTRMYQNRVTSRARSVSAMT